MRLFFNTLLITISIVLLSSCSRDKSTPPVENTYEGTMQNGWDSFSEGQYEAAKASFTEAKEMDITQADAFSALGWTLLMQDSIEQAIIQFNIGTQKLNVPADLYAGWAFVLNQQTNYQASTAKALFALSIESEWQFSHGVVYSQRTLYALLAANYFLTGNFSESLFYIKKLNEDFTADIYSPSGQAALAQQIEYYSQSNG